MGSPVVFTQERPGLGGKIFKIKKFRTMTDERDSDGNLLPDEQRLTKFGMWLRKVSGDELLELINIIKGDMSLVGPRPQLVRDMVFMTEEQLQRHNVRPGLSGLAQVKGRNAISWEEKFEWDIKYIENIGFINDLKLVFETIKIAIIKQEGITDDENATVLDYGDALLEEGKVSKQQYLLMQDKARRMLKENR